jgi:hypothetical protein
LRLFPKHAFVSLDLPNEAEQAEKEPDTFLQRHPPPVLIDEVQYAPLTPLTRAERINRFRAKRHERS